MYLSRRGFLEKAAGASGAVLGLTLVACGPKPHDSVLPTPTAHPSWDEYTHDKISPEQKRIWYKDGVYPPEFSAQQTADCILDTALDAWNGYREKKDPMGPVVARPHMNVVTAAELPELFKSRYAFMGFTKEDFKMFDTDVSRLRGKFDVFSLHGDMNGKLSSDIYIVSDSDTWTYITPGKEWYRDGKIIQSLGLSFLRELPKAALEGDYTAVIPWNFAEEFVKNPFKIEGFTGLTAYGRYEDGMRMYLNGITAGFSTGLAAKIFADGFGTDVRLPQEKEENESCAQVVATLIYRLGFREDEMMAYIQNGTPDLFIHDLQKRFKHTPKPEDFGVTTDEAAKVLNAKLLYLLPDFVLNAGMKTNEAIAYMDGALLPKNVYEPAGIQVKGTLKVNSDILAITNIRFGTPEQKGLYGLSMSTPLLDSLSAMGRGKSDSKIDIFPSGPTSKSTWKSQWKILYHALG